MNTTKMRAAVLATLIAATGTFGLAACSSGETAPATSQNQAADVDVAEDLTTARQAVEDALAENANLTQIMLAGDVKQPTEKYGLLVMPFVKSDAAERVTGTVNVKDGKYVIEAVSAESGTTYQIDQDGTISEASN